MLEKTEGVTRTQDEEKKKRKRNKQTKTKQKHTQHVTETKQTRDDIVRITSK